MTRRCWYEELDEGEDHPVVTLAHARLAQSAEYGRCDAEVRTLMAELRRRLDPEALRVWLALEAALNHRSELYAAACFDLGVKVGLAVGGAGTSLIRTGDIKAALARLG